MKPWMTRRFSFNQYASWHKTKRMQFKMVAWVIIVKKAAHLTMDCFKL